MYEIQLQIGYKLWLSNTKGDYVIGRGGADLLKAIDETHNISKATELLANRLSYRKAWGMLQKIKNHIGGLSPVETTSGGKGGGKTTLTPAGKQLLADYLEFEKIIDNACRKYQKKLEKK